MIKLVIKLETKAGIKSITLVFIGVLIWRVIKIIHPSIIPRNDGLTLIPPTTWTTQPKVAIIKFGRSWVP